MFRPDDVGYENTFPEPCSLAFPRCKSVSGSSSFPRLCFSHSNKTLGGNDSLLFNCQGSRKRLSPLRNLVRRRSREQQHRLCGANRDRTDDLRLAKPALSQLSYNPES